MAAHTLLRSFSRLRTAVPSGGLQLGDADTIADSRADGLLYAAADDRAQRSCAPFPGAENRYRTGTDKSTTGLGNLANYQLTVQITLLGVLMNRATACVDDRAKGSDYLVLRVPMILGTDDLTEGLRFVLLVLRIRLWARISLRALHYS